MTRRKLSLPLVLAGLVGGAATACGVALTATSGWLIVRASERPVMLTLLVAIVAVRTFGMARPFFRYVERVYSHDVALADLAGERTEVYRGLVPLTPARLGRRSRSSVLTGVVDDLTDVIEAQVRVTVPLIASAVAGIVAVIITAALAPAVGLVLVGLLLVLALGCWLAWRLESGSQEQLLQARAEVMRVSDLVARQSGELRAVGGEATALSWLYAAHRQFGAAVTRQSRGRALVAALILVGTGVAAAAAALLTAGGANAIAVASGPVAALLIVTPVAVGDALAPLAEAMRAQARADGAAARLHNLLDQTPAVRDPEPVVESEEEADAAADASAATTGPVARALAPHLRLEGVSASWTGHRIDAGPIDVDLPPGRHLAIVGANGSGKSTLLAVVARHLDPAAGRFTVDGRDVTTMPLADVRALMAIVDDEPHIFASTLRENLRLARPDADDDALEDALSQAGLDRWRAGLPDGLDTRIGSGGRGVSGGERARIGIARALLSGRPILLLDEPVAHLDHATAVSVLADLLSAATRHTVVMVSHRPEGLDGFDHVLDLSPDLSHAARWEQ